MRTDMRIKAIFLLAIFLVTLVSGCGNTQAGDVDYGKALDFELQDINGNRLRLSDRSGRIIILNFFATWCPPCRMEMPDFNQIAKEYKNDVEVIAVNIAGENLSIVRDFVDANKLEFPVAIDNNTANKLYGPINAIPVTVIIDKDFNIVRRYIGMRTKEVFVRDIEELSR
ncbi:MAG: hypothetical protein A2Z72_06090 [Omnitrophica bacterium RBG_13_46_9]|nr:MAG: hypothetical protein A2Z72_06090 [Omnitrophica bacterium RBG_13_46_9]